MAALCLAGKIFALTHLKLPLYPYISLTLEKLDWLSMSINNNILQHKNDAAAHEDMLRAV
jgi:hypothetical protein